MEAHLADGTILQFPDETSPEVVQRVVKQHIGSQPVATPQPQQPDWKASDLITGPTEAGMALGSGMAGGVASGLMGIATGGDPQAMQDVAQGTTYQPQSRGGQALTSAIQWPFQKLAEGADWVGKQVTDDPRLALTAVAPPLGLASYLTGQDMQLPPEVKAGLGAAANVAVQSIPALLGLRAKASAIADGGILDNIRTTIGVARGKGESLDHAVSNIVKKLAGDQLPAVIKALEGGTEYVNGAKPSAGEAIAQANMGRPDQFGGSLIRLQKDLTGAAGAEDIIPTAEKAQLAAMVTPMQRLAGGATTEAQDAAQAAAAAQRAATTAPLRENALNRANVAGVVAPEMQTGIESMSGGGGRTGLSQLGPIPDLIAKNSQEISMAQGQLDRLSREGLTPLKADNLLSSIDQQMRRVGSNSRDLVQSALQYAKDRIARVTRQDGTIDARDLYAARKDINEEIRNYLQSKPASDKTLAAGADTQIKQHIDAAIEGAGGIGWKNYLTTFAKMSEGIDRMKVAQLLTEKLKNEQGRVTAPQFLGAMGRGSEAMLKKSTGVPRYDSLGQLFDGQDLSHIQGVAKHLARQEEMRRIANATSGSAIGAVPTIPHFMSHTAALTNALMRHLSSDTKPIIARALAQKMVDPAELAALLREQPKPGSQPNQRAALIAELLQQQQTGN